MLRRRFDNEPAEEIRIAAEEQAKITDLRLLGL
jgi:2-oxo-4-hydroxy-4-carboxy--5-ureidoimidazoline (OHCU) decarboxylase